MKIRTKNKSHSREIQKQGKRLGYYFLGLKKSTYYSKPFLFFDSINKTITWHDSEKYFNDHPATETTLEELKLM